MARTGRLRLRPVRLYEGKCAGGKHIALDESHSAFSRDLAPAPGGGEVKHRDQPRMGDESTAASTDASNTASPGLDAAEPLTPREQVVVTGVQAADSAHEDRGLNGTTLRRNANTNRHSGLCRLPR
jgi:hypothetical protein